MKVVTVASKLQGLDYDFHENKWDEFKQLAKLTALRQALTIPITSATGGEGRFFMHWWDTISP